MTKLYAQEKRVFDINKVTVVGSPTITSDGVVSGFSRSNYVTLPVSFFPTALSFLVIEGEVLTNNLNTVNQAVFGALQQGSTLAFLGIRLTQTGGQFLYSTGVNLQKAITFTKNLTNNTFYRYKVEINKSNIKLYLNNEIVFEASDFVYVQPRQFNIGINRSLGDVFNGSIDLEQFKIYVDGELVYSPTKPNYLLERRKEGFDLSKFTVVGSPTITEAGVASGFTTNNYVTFNSVIDTNKTFNFKGSFVYKKATASQNVFHSFATTGGQLAGGCRILLGSTGNLTLWAYTGTVDGRVVLSANNFADGDNIDFEFSFSNNKRELKVSKDGGLNWIIGQNTTLLNFTGEWQGFTVGFDGWQPLQRTVYYVH